MYQESKKKHGTTRESTEWNRKIANGAVCQYACHFSSPLYIRILHRISKIFLAWAASQRSASWKEGRGFLFYVLFAQSRFRKVNPKAVCRFMILLFYLVHFLSNIYM
jgi:hypothetical protein